jgi:hypothetical protein
VTNIDIEPSLRDTAVKRLKKRRDFYTHLAVYAMVNGFLVVIWLMVTSPGFFWPVFAIFGWGIALVMQAWDVFWTHEITDAEIDREIARMTKR